MDVRLDEVVLHALEKEPERRYQHASQVKTDVETIAANRQKEEKPSAVRPAVGGRDYRSRRTFMGLPLFHVATGIDPATGRPRVAKGVIAIGARAVGVLAVGWQATGVFSVGLLACGVFPVGLLALGGVISVGLLAYGVCSAGLLALGGLMAVGGIAIAADATGLLAVGSRHAEGLLALAKQPGGLAWYHIGLGSFAAVAAIALLLAYFMNPRRSWRRLGFSLSVVALPILLGLLLTTNVLPDSSVPTFTVTGVVTDVVTGRPVAGARVDDNRYGASPGRVPQQAWTDANGHYELKTWYEEHLIAASAAGYETKLAILLTKPFGSERERRMDFRLRPAANSPAISLPPAAQVPPVIIQTIPQSGAADVDPALTELRVTFSKRMQAGGWSWSTWGEENYPETSGQARYLDDGCTCVLPVRLKPGKLYAIWLNSDKFHNFKDTDGQSAVPYLLIFETRQATGVR